MNNDKRGATPQRYVRWPLFAAILVLILFTLMWATSVWIQRVNASSEKTIDELGRFYLAEIAERNTGAIATEVERRKAQMASAVRALDADILSGEPSLRAFVLGVQRLNGLDIFAFADAEGMVYTADSTFSGLSRFGFLSEPVTETVLHIVNGFGTKTMAIIAMPVTTPAGANIPVTACFSGLDIEKIVSSEQLANAETVTYCRVFDHTGESLVKMQGEYPTGQNLFDILERTATFTEGYSVEKLREDWAAGRPGFTSYRNGAGDATCFYYKNVPGTDLILTTLMRESNLTGIVEKGAERTRRATIGYIAAFVMALSGIGVMVFSVIRRVRESQAENDRLKLIGALSNDYSDIFLMDPLHDSALSIKARGNIVPAGERLRRNYHATWESYIGRYVAPEDAEHMRAAVSPESLHAATRGGKSCSAEFRLAGTGEPHYYQVKFVPLPDDPYLLIAGFRNIDEQRLAEEERQRLLKEALADAQHASMAKTTFLNNMSHDIRTPMNAIIGFAELAAKHMDEPERVAEDLKKIRTAGGHLMDLINDVLDMSRIESGKVKLEENPEDLKDIAAELKTIVQADIEAKGLRFTLDDADLGAHELMCDRLRLSRILMNLLSNAIKFTEPGGEVRLTVKELPGAPEGSADVEFRVADTGIGIGEEFRKHIFEAFTRERTSTVSGIRGTGLGMAITKSLVDLMGGTIAVDSTPGKGSVFTVRLRLRVAEGTGRSTAQAVREHDFTGLRLLLAEDNELNREIALEILTGRGIVADTATDGTEAVARMEEAPAGTYALILMDIQMPLMDGYEATRRIRALEEPGKRGIPIVAMTANAFEEDRKKAVAAGMNGHVAKPIVVDELFAAIAEVLEAR